MGYVCKEIRAMRMKEDEDRAAMMRRLAARDREYARAFPAYASGCRRGVIPACPRGSKGLAMPLNLALFSPHG